MTFKTTFIIGVAVAAMALVPVAVAQPMSDASDRAQQATVGSYPDAIERAVFARENAARAVSTYPDVFERAVANRPTPSGALVGHVDRYEVDLPKGQVTPRVSSSGSVIEWPQLGLGFGLGIVFVLGTILAVRLTRSRALAHG